MEARFELAFECGEKTLEVRRFVVHEELSRTYDIDIVARSPNHNIDLEAIAGKTASLTIRSDNPRAQAPERTWAGVCSHIVQLRAERTPGAIGLSTYRLRIVPRMWLMTHNKEHRIFQRKTIPEVVQDVLKEWKIEPKLKLNEQYKKLDYLVQWGESDFTFVNRLCERAGITYFFDHAGGMEGELTLSDQPHSSAPRAAIRYNDKPAVVGAEENIGRLRLAERVAPGKYTIGDYDFRRPSFTLRGEATPAAAPEDFYEQYHYVHGASVYLDPAGRGAWPTADDKGKVRAVDEEVKNRAQRGLDAERCRKRIVAFETNVIDLFPGNLFNIQDPPRDELGKTLLVTAFTIEASHNEAWTEVGEAVFAEHPYRPAELTPTPAVHGLQSAIVVGPSGEEIYTDEHGRVRVQFQWDREGKHDDSSSCWMRVSQGWAGKGYGKVWIPRIDQEVLVGFFEGDPDRPIVVGRAYNGRNTVPGENELPRYKTRSSWMTDTSPHADNSYNAIRLEDAKTKEYVYTQAQRDQQKLVKRHETERTGQNRAEVVGTSRAAVVANVDAVLVGKKWSLQMIEQPQPDQLKILQLGRPEVAPLSTKLEMVDKKILCTSGEATAVMDGPDITFEAKQMISFKAGGNIIVKGGPNVHINPSGGGSAQGGCLEKGAGAGAPFVEKAK